MNIYADLFVYVRLKNGDVLHVCYRIVRAGINKMVSAKYMEKYFAYPHQIWYTEAPGQDKDQVRTGWPWTYIFEVTEVI